MTPHIQIYKWKIIKGYNLKMSISIETLYLLEDHDLSKILLNGSACEQLWRIYFENVKLRDLIELPTPILACLDEFATVPYTQQIKTAIVRAEII